ncbi:MAG: hypothetical protein ACI3VA_00165 [Candidatus Limivicinus sp.]
MKTEPRKTALFLLDLHGAKVYHREKREENRVKIHTIQIETACRSPLKRQPRHMPKISIPPQREILIAVCADASAAEWRLI